jgi:hypothetical protein
VEEAQGVNTSTPLTRRRTIKAWRNRWLHDEHRMDDCGGIHTNYLEFKEAFSLFDKGKLGLRGNDHGRS